MIEIRVAVTEIQEFRSNCGWISCWICCAMLIVESQILDIYRNLAVEEYVMDHVHDRGPVLFLWRSDCAVVMGKNQNPWRECRLDVMAEEGVPLARRLSGGGTVYHDAGNLNYCVVVKREDYREAQAYDMVLQALASLGVAAEKTGKSNLSVGGRKFSGNAFAFRKGRAMHHGTLLLHTDLERLQRYLGPMVKDIDTHAIASIPASVANLALNIPDVSRALREAFEKLYGGGEPVCWSEGDMPSSTLDEIERRLRSDEWLYEATPKFSVDSASGCLEVVGGHVSDGGKKGESFKELAFSLRC